MKKGKTDTMTNKKGDKRKQKGDKVETRRKRSPTRRETEGRQGGHSGHSDQQEGGRRLSRSKGKKRKQKGEKTDAVTNKKRTQ